MAGAIAIQVDDSRFMDHFRLHHDRIAGLEDLIIAVIAVGNHGRDGGWEEQASILKPHIGRPRRMVEAFQASLSGGRGERSEAGKQTIGRIGDDGRPEAGLHQRAGFEAADRIGIAFLFLQLGGLLWACRTVDSSASRGVGAEWR